jgi:hypothetical protein
MSADRSVMVAWACAVLMRAGLARVRAADDAKVRRVSMVSSSRT